MNIVCGDCLRAFNMEKKLLNKKTANIKLQIQKLSTSNSKTNSSWQKAPKAEQLK